MKGSNVRRVIAIIAIVLLLAIYIVLFILALADSSESMRYFMTAVFASIVIPIILAWFMWMYRIKHGDDEEKQ